MAVNIYVETAGLQGPEGPEGQSGTGSSTIIGTGSVTVTYIGQTTIISGSTQSGITNTSGLATSGDLAVINNNLQTTGSTLLNLINASSNSNIVYTTGTQIISGQKSFEGSNIYFGEGMGLTPLLYISTGSTVQISDSNVVAFDSNLRTLYDNFAHATINWQSKMLYDFFQSGSLDWNNRILYDSSGNQNLDWQNKILYGDWTIPDLTQTGIVLEGQINSLSGYSNNTFATINNLFITGKTLYGDIVGVSGILNNSGITLQTEINTLTTNITTTGQTLYGDIVGLSGILNNSGITLQSEINTITANLTTTGQTLYQDITGFSGIFNATGAALQSEINNLGLVYVTQSTYNAFTSAIANNLSTTGINLYNDIIGLSGQITGALYLTGINPGTNITVTNLNNGSFTINYAGGAGTNVEVTGSVSLGTANLTGIGGMLVMQSGNYVLFSGGGGGGSTINNINTGTQLSITGSNYLIIANISGKYGITIYQTGISGIIVDDSITQTNLTTTGQTLYNDIIGLSGILNNTGITLQTEINTITNNLVTTGSNIYNDVIGLSGITNSINSSVLILAGDINTVIANLTTTGQTLYNDIVGLSGVLNNSGVTLQSEINTVTTNLTITGQTIYNDIVGLSGIVNTSGITLQNEINALNGNYIVYTTGIQTIGGNKTFSGNHYFYDIYPSGLSFTGVTGLIYRTGISGQFYINDTGNLISVDFYNRILSGNWNSNNLNISGNIVATANNLLTTGQNLFNIINSVGTNLSGNLYSTGSNLYNDIIGLSGVLNSSGITLQTEMNTLTNNLTLTGLGIGILTTNLGTTGSTLYVDLTGLSGQFNINFATTTNLGTTGQTLYNDIVGLSGVFNTSGTNWQNEINTITNNLTNTGLGIGILTTNLGTTGSVLYKDIIGLSGEITGSLYLTGINPGTNIGVTNLNNGAFTVNYAGGAGSNVEVTGSSALATANFTGFNGINVFASGNYVCITGGAGGTTNNYYTGTQLSVTGSSYLLVGNLSGINGITVSQVGSSGINIDGSTLNTNCINNSNNLSGNLTTTGQTLLTNDTVVSGFFAHRPELYFPFNTASLAWAVPGAVTLFNSNNSSITYLDLSSFTGAQLLINKLATSSQVTGALWLGYSTTYTQTAANYSPLSSTNLKSYINVANTFVNSGWQPITTLAKSGVYVALLGSGGNAVSVTFGQIMMGLM